MNRPIVSTSEKHRKAIESVVEQFLSELNDRIHSIVLFGSVARGEATEESDIDLLGHTGRADVRDQAPDERHSDDRGIRDGSVH